MSVEGRAGDAVADQLASLSVPSSGVLSEHGWSSEGVVEKEELAASARGDSRGVGVGRLGASRGRARRVRPGERLWSACAARDWAARARSRRGRAGRRRRRHRAADAPGAGSRRRSRRSRARASCSRRCTGRRCARVRDAASRRGGASANVRTSPRGWSPLHRVHALNNGEPGGAAPGGGGAAHGPSGAPAASGAYGAALGHAHVSAASSGFRRGRGRARGLGVRPSGSS